MRCNDPGYQVDTINLPIMKEELEYRINSLNVELNEVEISSRRFQELKIETPKLSNLVLYCCLMALSYINIIDVKVEAVDTHYTYSFLLSQRQNYKVTSTATFKRDLIERFNQNVVVNQ